MEILAAVGVVLAFLLVGVAIFTGDWLRARHHLREARIVRCPETRRLAAVSFSTRAATDLALGRDPALRIGGCTRWPRKRGCDQRCLEQLAGDPPDAIFGRRVETWLEDARCAGCGKPLAREKRSRLRLASPAGTVFEWSELPLDWLAEAIGTWSPICRGCDPRVTRPPAASA